MDHCSDHQGDQAALVEEEKIRQDPQEKRWKTENQETDQRKEILQEDQKPILDRKQGSLETTPLRKQKDLGL